MYLDKAQKIAEDIVEKLRPACKQIHIAGSIRRQKKYVGDIEIVCEIDSEKIASTERISLFEEKKNILFFDLVKTLGASQNKIEDDSRYIKILLPEEIMLDIFIPQPEDYGRQLCIRTGNWVYSKDVVAVGWRKCGWVGTKDGLRKFDECSKMGRQWICNVADPTLPPVFNTEKQFLDFIGVEYVEPKLRELEPNPRNNPDGEEI